MKPALLLAATLIASAWAQSAQADKCSNARPIVPLMVVVQPEQPGAPGKVEILAHDLDRGPNTSGLKCVSVGSLGFQVQAPADDETPPERLGYLLTLEPADAWWRFGDHLIDRDDPRPLESTDGWVWFNFDDMPEEPVDWTFRLAAVDEDGNQGEWSEPVQVIHKGMNFGCATGSGHGSLGLLLWVGLALFRRRAGCSESHPDPGGDMASRDECPGCLATDSQGGES